MDEPRGLLRRCVCALLLALNSCVIVPFVETDDLARIQNQRADGQGGAESRSNWDQRWRGSDSGKQRRLTKYIRDMESGATVTRTHAAYWLGEMGGVAVPAVPVLISNLSHESHWVRRACVKALGKIGDSSAVPALTKMLRDRNRFVAHSAANALRKFNSQSARAALKSYKGI